MESKLNAIERLAGVSGYLPRFRHIGMKENQSPLRRIVNCEPTMSNPAYGTPIQIGVTEVLECGHRIAQKKDIYGPTNANKRRCRKCAKLVADND